MACLSFPVARLSDPMGRRSSSRRTVVTQHATRITQLVSPAPPSPGQGKEVVREEVARGGAGGETGEPAEERVAQQAVGAVADVAEGAALALEGGLRAGQVLQPDAVAQVGAGE